MTGRRRLGTAVPVLLGALPALLLPLGTGATATDAPPSNGIHKIQHVVIIMQENRSFDSYFGTFPGADGIPMQEGVSTVCVPDPKSSTCVKPYHDPKDRNAGGPHAAKNATADIDGDKMDGFVKEARAARRHCRNPNIPACTNDGGTDVMGYHDAREIPNYWTYAQQFVLQDRMFEPSASWSLPAHLFMVPAWSAKCDDDDPMSCHNELQNPDGILPHPRRKHEAPPQKPPNYA